jgi:hypothetical protein
MTKCCNLIVNYGAIFGMTIVSIQSNGSHVNLNTDKPKVKTKVVNNSKAFHLRRPKLT